MDIQLLEHPRLKEKPSVLYFIMSFLLFDVLLFIIFFAFAVSQPIKQSRPILRFNQNGEFSIMQVLVRDWNKGIDYGFSLWWWFERHALNSVLPACRYWNGASWLRGIYGRYGDWIQLGWNPGLVRAAMEGVHKGCYREQDSLRIHSRKPWCGGERNRSFLRSIGRPESRADCPFGPDKPPQPHRVRSGRSTQLHQLRNSSFQLYKRLESGNEPLVLRLWKSWMQRRGYEHVRLHRTRRSGVVQATIGRTGSRAGRPRSSDGVFPHSSAGIHGWMERKAGASEVRRRITTRRDTKCRWRAARESIRESWMRFWKSRRDGEEIWKRECGGSVRGAWPSERFLGGLSRVVYGVWEEIGIWWLWNPGSYSKRSACAANSRESLFVRYVYRWRELEAWMAGGYALDERHAVLLQCWLLCLLQKEEKEEERRCRRYQESLRSVAFWMSHSPSFSFITPSTWAINSRTRSLSCFVMSRRLASWLRDSTSTESPRCSNLNRCFLISFCKDGYCSSKSKYSSHTSRAVSSFGLGENNVGFSNRASPLITAETPVSWMHRWALSKLSTPPLAIIGTLLFDTIWRMASQLHGPVNSRFSSLSRPWTVINDTPSLWNSSHRRRVDERSGRRRILTE